MKVLDSNGLGTLKKWFNEPNSVTMDLTEIGVQVLVAGTFMAYEMNTGHFSITPHLKKYMIITKNWDASQFTRIQPTFVNVLGQVVGYRQMMASFTDSSQTKVNAYIDVLLPDWDTDDWSSGYHFRIMPKSAVGISTTAMEGVIDDPQIAKNIMESSEQQIL